MKLATNGIRRSGRVGPVGGRLVVGGMLLMLLSGCDNLLEVELPGNLTEADLTDPVLANTLVLSAQGAFECGYSAFLWGTGMWTGDLLSTNNRRTSQIVAGRLASVTVMDVETDCRTKQPPPLFLPLQSARRLGDDAAERIAGFPQGTVTDAGMLIGKALAYSGYSIQLLSEAFCEMTIQAGPRLTRAQGFSEAEERFTRALTAASQVTSGPNAAEAQRVMNLARVGRARARLFLGNTAGVIEDASQVTEGFVQHSTHSASDPVRWNQIHEENNATRNVSIHESYHGLTVGGVPDPRVPVVFHGLGGVPDGVTPVWYQLKVPQRNSPHPFASWREAQLMIAEVQGGQEAVAIINRLRDTYDLPHFSSSDPAAIDAEVLEERRRELWLQGNRLGDMLRLGISFPDGVNHRNEPYGVQTCIPIFLREEIGNPNL